METFENQTFDEERAFYGSEYILVKNCSFDGPADGESAFKECEHIEIEHCFFNLRYPFWHNHELMIHDSNLTDQCRAALWYSDKVTVSDTRLHGIKAFRECTNVHIRNCNIISPEFGWSINNLNIKNTTAVSEYFLMRSANIRLENVTLHGKYSFQYIQNAVLEKCSFDTKDAFWHGKNITVKNSIIKGEYLAWYSDGLTLINCKITGTQPFCYCKNLKLIDCQMIDTDLAFEKSDVEATIITKVDSIKNPHSGFIRVPEIGELIMDDDHAQGKVMIENGLDYFPSCEKKF